MSSPPLHRKGLRNNKQDKIYYKKLLTRSLCDLQNEAPVVKLELQLKHRPSQNSLITPMY